MRSPTIALAMKRFWILALPLFPLIVLLDMVLSPSIVGAPVSLRGSVRLAWHEWRRLAGY